MTGIERTAPPCKHTSPEPDTCRWCHMAMRKDTRYAYKWWGLIVPPLEESPVAEPAVATPAAPSATVLFHPACLHRGEVTGSSVLCGTCKKKTSLKVFTCTRHERCTIGQAEDAGITDCMRCPERRAPLGVSLPVRETVPQQPWRPWAEGVPPGRRPPARPHVYRARPHSMNPSWPIRFDEHNLWPGVRGKRFNPSLLRWGQGYLFCARNGWAGSDIYLGRLDKDFNPVGTPWKLELFHGREANYGREDPRLFVFRGRVHVAYVGVVGGHSILHTSMLYARLNADLRVEQVYYPQLKNRRAWEKNWAFFEHSGNLYAVYTIVPHVILRLDGENCERVHESPSFAPWQGGELRGGASPVRVGDEYWHFCHDRIEDRGHRIYRTALVTFNAEPPFALRRWIPDPILHADRGSRPPDQYASVVWTAGAVRAGDDWILANGVHDRTSELVKIPHASLRDRLLRITPPPWWRHNTGPDDHDRGIFSWVVGRDEYRLSDLDLTGACVLDVGAHAGDFAYACRSRGVALVHAYEPDPVNLGNLRPNAARLGGVRVFREAVVGGDSGQGRWKRNVDGRGGRVIHDPTGTTSTVSLNAAIACLMYESGRNVVDLVKIDCEGAEAEIFDDPALDLSRVTRLIGEYHPPLNPGWLMDRLGRHNFTCEFTPGDDGRGLFFAGRQS